MNSDKTRLIEFGRFAIENRAKRGEGKPETFDFLGFTHICAPERPEFVKNFLGQSEDKKGVIPFYGERLTVKPGVTGWAQVMYPYAASYEQSLEKLEYDLFYIKNMSFALDVAILLKTIRVVLFGRGAK